MTSSLQQGVTAPQKKRTWIRFSGLAVGGFAVLLATLASLAFGARVVSLDQVLTGIFGQPENLGAIAVAERIPRTAIALSVGACLGVSGALMQAVTRNPIADPGILGVNTGASLAIVVGVAFFGISGLASYVWIALLGAVVTAVFVYTIGSAGPGGTTPVKLALAGVATSAALSSCVAAVMLPRAASVDDFRFWQVGSLGRGDFATLRIVAPFAILALLIALLNASALNSLALGDETATGLGVNVFRTRLAAAGAGVTLCAVATAVAGPIGFVGLMVPHVVRLLIGPDQRWLIIGSALAGASLLTLSDVIGRVIARPTEVAVGIVTAFVGAPVLVFIVHRVRVRQL